MGDSFIGFISSNFFMLWIESGVILILYNLLLIILKFIRYKKIMREYNHSLEEVRYSRHNYLINKYSLLASTLFVIFSLISIFSIGLDNPSNTSKDKLPLSLEDFNIDI